jgi:4-hydroxybenzoate polyprenyltransferase
MVYRLHIMVAPRVSPEPQAPAIPADAISRSWVENAPHAAQPYLRLMRLDRPIGAWLLYLPCVFGLALGTTSLAHGFGNSHDLVLVVLFGLGAIVMRGAGCTYNDIVDRNIDAQVARTRERPIPSGAVSVRAACLFLGAQCAVGLMVLLQLNRFSIVLGAASLALIAAYPFMKRITWWPQAWLGLTFNWGALLGFSAITGHLAWPAISLYAGCILWTLGYDTIYAHQDREDDAMIGVKSTARLFGENSRNWITGFYSLAAALLALAMLAAGSPGWSACLLLPAAAHLFWQSRSVEIDAPEKCLKLFRANRDTGFMIAAALVASTYLKA